ncbi:MAG: rhodanese-like domain-containing protein [Hyphomicrobiaceae bacterium]
MGSTVDAATVKSWLSDGGEIAFFDVREAGPFADGHPFFAVPLPYSRLELDLEHLAPIRSVRVVLCDGGDGVAEKAKKRAEALGYANVSVLEGGAPGWKRAGYTLYEGVNLPSKTFGELIEHERHTPRITAQDLDAMKRRRDDFVIVDGRTWAEYTRFNIPGGISCPNGELVLRIGEIAPDPKTTVVVNCAGRTRSIIGAQTLIDFGVANKVVALENGTQGWFLAGYDLQRGADLKWPEPPKDAGIREAMKAKAQRHAQRHGVTSVTPAMVETWLDDASRTTYLLDVRTAEEASTSPIPGFRHAPGGQLVQATDQWVGVRGARIVIADGEMIRAPMVAAWLRQLGHEACVLDGNGVASASDGSGVRAESVLPDVLPLSAGDAAAKLDGGAAQAVDLRSSAAWSAGHVPGSVWSIRPHIASAVDTSRPAILIADDVMVARAAAVDLAEAGARGVTLLSGGIKAWQATGRSLTSASGQPPDAERIDFVFHTAGRHEGNAEAARAYLAWETNLVSQLDSQERGVFRLAPNA